ncbi:Nuclear pore complex protein NUP50B [Linum perenne]
MGDSENALPPSKKRAAGREISKDNPGLDDDEDLSEMEAGTFKKASDEVLATRRIVKVRRSQSTAASSVPKAPVSNPFAGIRLVSPSDPTAAPQPGTTGVTSYEKVPSDIKDDACNVTEESKKDADKKHGKSSLSESVVEAATEKENTENKVNAATVSEGAEPIEHPEKPLEDKAENKLTNMDKRGITFACINSVGEGQEALSTFALKFRDGSIVEDFRAAVMQHKDHNTSAVLKTPENSP